MIFFWLTWCWQNIAFLSRIHFYDVRREWTRVMMQCSRLTSFHIPMTVDSKFNNEKNFAELSLGGKSDELLLTLAVNWWNMRLFVFTWLLAVVIRATILFFLDNTIFIQCRAPPENFSNFLAAARNFRGKMSLNRRRRLFSVTFLCRREMCWLEDWNYNRLRIRLCSHPLP